MNHASSHLARHLAGAYTLLIVYASLHPFSGWREPVAPLLAYLTAAWPRYWTVFDLVTNVLAYAPLGFLLVPALHPRVPAGLAALVATLAAASLSFAMETLQNFLPMRVPSNLDLGTNVLGALLGALSGLRWGRALVDGGRLHALRLALFHAGQATDFGLVLVALWLLTQLNPEILLFGTGDLRALLELPPVPYSAPRFLVIEGLVAGAGLLAAGLLASSLLRRSQRVPLLALLGAALVVKAFSEAVLMSAAQFLQWLTPGNAVGLAAGTLTLLVCAGLPHLAKQILAALALLFATALVNLAPENPYNASTLAVWQQGHFFNFNGLTRLVSSLWPFAALIHLMLPRGRQTTEFP